MGLKVIPPRHMFDRHAGPQGLPVTSTIGGSFRRQLDGPRWKGGKRPSGRGGDFDAFFLSFRVRRWVAPVAQHRTQRSLHDPAEAVPSANRHK